MPSPAAGQAGPCAAAFGKLYEPLIALGGVPDTARSTHLGAAERLRVLIGRSFSRRRCRRHSPQLQQQHHQSRYHQCHIVHQRFMLYRYLYAAPSLRPSRNADFFSGS